MSRRCLLPLLQVFAKPGGVIVRHMRVGGLPPVDEPWWREVLWDWRARLPIERDIARESHHANYRLDRQRGTKIQAGCACNHLCPLLDKAELIRAFGPETNVVWIVRELSGCKNRNKVANMCQALPLR